MYFPNIDIVWLSQLLSCTWLSSCHPFFLRIPWRTKERLLSRHILTLKTVWSVFSCSIFCFAALIFPWPCAKTLSLGPKPFSALWNNAISVKCLKLIVSPYSKSSPKKDNFLMRLSHLLEMQKNLFCLHLPEPSSGVSMQFNCNCHLGNDCKDLAECMNHWVGF